MKAPLFRCLLCCIGLASLGPISALAKDPLAPDEAPVSEEKPAKAVEAVKPADRAGAVPNYGNARPPLPPLEIPEGVDPDLIRDAGRAAIDQALGVLFTQPKLPKRFAIVPVQRDVEDDYFTLQLKNAFTSAGAAREIELYISSKDESSEMNNLISEIARGQRYGDTMDASTVQKFGKFKGIEGVITARLNSVRQITDPRDPDKATVQVRINVQAFEVTTGRIIWGREETGVLPVPEKRMTAGSFFSGLTGKQLAIGGAGLAGLFVLFIVIGRIRSAARPR